MSSWLSSRAIHVVAIGWLLATSTPLSASAACTSLPVTATAWWRADGTGDEDIGNRDATLVNGAAFGTGYVGSGAFQFDGADDYASIVNDAAFNPGAGDITVHLWVHPVADNGEMVMVEKFNESDGSTGWSLGRRFGSIYYAGGTGDIQTSESIPIGVWTHIAMRRSGGTVTLFKNGSPVASAGITGNFDNPHEILIGRRRGAQGFYWNGRIDEVQLHVGTGLSDEHIQAIYDAGSEGLCPPTVCGDGLIEGVEQCDDSNTTDGDGCDSNCRVTGCPNGVVTAPEACDDGNMTDSDACKSDCTPNTCGDGVVYVGVELCDDGNADETDGCESDCTPAEVCMAPLSGLAAWWPGEDSIGDIAGGQNAVLEHGAAYAAGKVGRAFDLDGGDDFVSVPSHVSLNVGTGDFTIDLWASFDDTDGEQVLVEKYVQKFDDEASAGWTLTKLDRNSLQLATGAGSVDSPRLTIVADTWVHFAARRSGQQLAIFMNGAPIGTANADTLTDLSSSSSLKLGHRGSPSDTAGSGDTRGFFLRGRIDEVHLFSRALSNSEVLALYNTGDAGLCVPAPVCGNGLTEAGEGCDDGNALADDGCENDCTSSCGNGTTAGDEECDDANPDEGDGCDTNCTVSACGNTIAAGGEECDDGNPDDGDGCDTNCTVTACGNGVRTGGTGEGCDDGNLVDDDGCESDCRFTPVLETVPPGGTVTTDPGGFGATPETPIQTAITTPGGGEILIATSDVPLSEEGVHALIDQLLIEADPTSALEPLVIVVTIDASVIPPGVDLLRVDLTRNGQVLQNCSGAPGVASPDPCIQSRVLLVDGDVQITGLTSNASLWSAVVRGLSKVEQKCVGGANRAGARVAAAQSKLAAACMKSANAGKLADAEACVAADAGQDVAGAEQKTIAFCDDACAAPPPFAFTGAAAISAAARAAKLELVDDVLGNDLNAAVTGYNDVASCQSAALKAVEKLFATKTKLLLGCIGDGLAGAPQLMIAANDLDDCYETLDADPDSKAAKRVGKLAGALVDRCGGSLLANALPGACASSEDVSYCLETRVDCRLCRMMNAMDGAASDCDAFDDGAVNGSCN